MIDAHEFINTIFADKSNDEHVCVSEAKPKRDGKGFWFNNMTPEDRVWRKWSPDKKPRAWYFCVSSITGEKNEKGTMVRRGRGQLLRAHCLVLDDIGTKGAPPPVAPSWVLESSPGNEQWGFMLDPTADLDRYEALVEYCHQQGWGDAGAGGSYRVMRVPGSANLKPGRQNFRSVVTRWQPDIWTLDELALELGCDFDQVEIKSSTVDMKAGGVMAKENIDLLLDWLVDGGHVVADNGNWVDIVCPWADRHTSGANTAGYSPLGRGDGEWVQRRAFKCQHEHCLGESFRTFMKWAKEKGAPVVSGVDPLPWLQDKFTYIGFGKRVADLHQRPLGGRWLWDLEDWGNMHKGRIMIPGRDQPIEIKTAFLEHRETVKVVDTQYWPVRADEDVSIVKQDGQSLVNVYVPPNWSKTDKEPEVFLDHIDFLLPDDVERDLFLDWLAHKVQNPALRSYAMVMVAEDAFGVGRSWLKSMMERVWQGKVQTATLGQLIGKGTSAEQNYNDWAVGCQLLVVEEAKDNLDKDDFYHGYETFKQRVDTRVMTVRVNPKYGRTRDDFMFFNCLIFSNHSDALAIPENDRRICVLTNPVVMQNVEYYDRLNAALDGDEARRIYWYLMERDIAAFDHVYPPDTPGKRKMVDQNKAPSDEIRDYILETLHGDIVTKDVLKGLVVAAAHKLDYQNIMMNPGGVIRSIWGKIGSLRDDKNGARYVFDGAQTEVRALRNREKWVFVDQERDLALFRDELVKAVLPSPQSLN